MKQKTYVSGEKTGKGRKVEMKTLPVHQVGHEERCEQENERGRLGKWRENTEERRKGRRDKKRERKEGHTQREAKL